MSYRKDDALEPVLRKATNEDLLLLADVLQFSSSRDKENNVYRWAATMYLNNDFKECYPNKLNNVWEIIAEEFQRFSGNTLANVLRGHGVTYKEILHDACDWLHVKDVNFKEDAVPSIESQLLNSLVEQMRKQMTPEQEDAFIASLNKEKAYDEDLRDVIINKDNLGKVLNTSFANGGILSIMITSQIVNEISRYFLGRGIQYALGAGVGQVVGRIAFGPIGWGITALLGLIDIMGPNKKVVIQGTIIVSFIRMKILHDPGYAN